MWKPSKNATDFLIYNETLIIELYKQIATMLYDLNNAFDDPATKLNDEEIEVLTCCGIANLYNKNSLNVADLGEPPWAVNGITETTAHQLVIYTRLLKLEQNGYLKRNQKDMWTLPTKPKNGKARK